MKPGTKEHAQYMQKSALIADYAITCPTCRTTITAKSNRALVELLGLHIDNHCQDTCFALSLS
jgi:dihydroxyacid dehydratase/phosphogluconate dehydratase